MSQLHAVGRRCVGIIGAVLFAALSFSAAAQQTQAPAADDSITSFVPGPIAEAKDKTISIFYRGPNSVSREEYQRRYLELHTFIGMMYVPNVIGYTVNMTDSAGGPDAITELWIPSWKTLFSEPWRPYLQEDRARVEADERNWHDVKSVNFIVDEQVLKGGPIQGEVGRSPGVKLIWLYRRGQPVPPPPTGAWRVVDNRVLHQPDGRIHNGTWKEGTSDIVLIRMAWAKDLATIGPIPADTVVSTEWRNRPSPWK